MIWDLIHTMEATILLNNNDNPNNIDSSIDDNGENLTYSASGFDPVITSEKNKIKKAILEMTA